ncbi:hypothetical protein BDV59DRAFT_188220 [Aspergillus ambiguus]|uniref:uncharacterized protein n=1 Tax=Aspergillus ambiguus TaxID=176160 RepID=UPI003CCCAAD0
MPMLGIRFFPSSRWCASILSAVTVRSCQQASSCSFIPFYYFASCACGRLHSFGSPDRLAHRTSGVPQKVL